MSERLRQLLHEGVGDVREPDLVGGALRSATRLGRTRRMTGLGAAVLVVAGLTGGYLGWQPATDDPAPHGDLTVDTPADSVPDRWDTIPDTLYFTTGLDGRPGLASLAADGTIEAADFTFPSSAGGTVGLSPDGHWWSVLDATGLSIGMTLDDDGKLSGSRPTMLTIAQDDLCGPHRWSPDGSRIVVGSCAPGAVGLVIVDTTNGTVAETIELPDVDPDVMRYFFSAVWNADGSAMVWGDADDGFVIADADGNDPQPFDIAIPDSRQQDPVAGTPAMLFVGSVHSLSADGRYAGITWGYSEDGALPDVEQADPNDSYDPQGTGPFSVDSMHVDELIDTTTGETVPLPEEIPQIFAMAVSPNGEMLIHHFDGVNGGEWIRLYSSDWEMLDERELTDDLEANAGGVEFASYL